MLSRLIKFPSHDRVRVGKVSEKQWKSDIIGLLDHDLTFGGADPDEILSAAYKHIVHGRTPKVSPETTGVKRPSNLADLISRERTLHFSDAESWFKYNEMYGTQSIFGAWHSHIENRVRDTALMEFFGPNPEYGYEKLKSVQKERYKDTSRKLTAGKERSLDAMYNVVSGKIYHIEADWMAQLGSGIRAVESTAKLGSSAISSVTDVPFAAAEFQWQGGNLATGFQRQLTASLDRVLEPERELYARAYGLMTQGLADSFAGARYASQDLPSGVLHKLTSTFFKLPS